MNPVIDAIVKRRSVRAYDANPLSKELIQTIIAAGNEAPSAMNTQPWRFVVFQDEAARKKLVEAAKPRVKRLFESLKDSNQQRYEIVMQRFREMEDPIFYSAPVVIFVIGSGPHAPNSCPLPCENMMLAAHSLGLGSCWIGSGAIAAEDSDIKELLELKEGESLFGPIIFGHVAEYPSRPEKKPPMVKWI